MWVPLSDRIKIREFSAAQKLFSDCFAWSDMHREHLWVAHLDDEFCCLYLECFSGDPGHAPMPILEIIAAVIENKSKGLLLAHNHPSGNSRPSSSDIHITRHLATTSKGIGCSLHDHLISGGAQWSSFRQLGLL